MTPTTAPGRPGWIRPLGRTGLEVSAVCLGGGPLGSMPDLFGRDVPADQGVETVLAALDSPIRFVDTSNGYSDGESERRIGEALRRVGGLPQGVTVATKVDPRDGDYSGDRVRASVAESRERLGLDHLPLVHLHDPEFWSFDELTAPGGAVDALVALRESGEVGAIGLAGGRVQEIARYLALGVFDVLLVHNRWTLLDRSAGPLLDEAERQGMGILNAAVHGGGILAKQEGGPTTYGYREAPPEVLEAAEAMRRVCAEHGTDIATAALQFSLRDPRVAATIVGMSRPGRVAQTVAAAQAELPDALWPELEALLPPARTWLDAE
ncbi:aldo/keto reductase [Cellulomonas fimi]|uniref:Pyridoxal 4-dehydrogenase n=1 Tax=Cellulomonas fimi (strain ATCC 484 / DSM 20113 / JCM 1341 / CCUG 24087 / LMG 16345 / NBRC 15513 / NCIMB 8980 / NCTC 7547 / NRS-133) TaxID=590998 RepID=F4H5L5_CELFA|nr:aldo/keto reductase [Cellulomonas fimi]AEE44339.1 Pyridoxal 4-dehydrogenase [Cellulomonas fimi ATCC 484]NNH08136.1 aldo/keto reductase [Cellulomonas fimi]VEH26156.1 Pyridoxal 4-dehydrogenase [Cellulomonas fimi]